MTAAAIFVTWMNALPFVAKRGGSRKTMREEKAAERSISGDVPSYDHATPILSGPATGIRWTCRSRSES